MTYKIIFPIYTQVLFNFSMFFSSVQLFWDLVILFGDQKQVSVVAKYYFNVYDQLLHLA